MRNLCLFPLLAALILCSCQTPPAGETRSAGLDSGHPNILLILTDDMGWGDISAHGNRNVQTPTIDQLVNEGVSFERFYASPVCSPTRASLLTGRHSLATGVYSVTRGGEKMFSDETTLAEALKQAGYRTGLFGKWHNGLQYPYDPNGQGFDEFYGFADGHITDYFDGEIQHNQDRRSFKGYLPDRLTDKTLEFIRSGDSPFFAMLSFNTPHSPYELPRPLFDKYKAMGLDNVDASVYGMVENIEHNLQRLLNQLDQQGVLDNTIVVFLSDNGPAFPGGNQRYNGGLKGWKGKVDEGGVRVPFAIYWRGHVKTGYRVKTPGQHIDILPTLLSLAGVSAELNKPLHGADLTPLLQGEHSDTLDNRALFTHHFRNTRRPGETAVAESPGAIRQGGWLATVDTSQKWSLYHLDQDPQQQHELSESFPDRLAQLKRDYLDWYRKTRLEQYHPLPIQLGYQQQKTVELPAHEAEVIREGLDYRHKDGWAHDWIITTGQAPGSIRWPLQVIQAGRYRITLLYNTPEGQYSGAVSLQAGAQKIPLPGLTPSIGKTRTGRRLAMTGEAPTQTWGQVSTVASLPQGSYDLTISAGQDRDKRNLEIKGLLIQQVRTSP